MNVTERFLNYVVYDTQSKEATLSGRGLLCPNLGTGTFNHHGVTEFANIRQMNQCVELIKELLTIQ